jgi:hypothetical protein
MYGGGVTWTNTLKSNDAFSLICMMKSPGELVLVAQKSPNITLIHRW